ncbi:MAG: hypothetical protein M3R24_39480 [Chloroflexota bacterium]|nr:hypothetical protein [Chloroflexota bacterium]
MAQSSLTHLSRQTTGQALRQARITYRNEPAMLSAINKAALELEASPWQFTGDELTIESRTTLGKRYTVSTFSPCTCKAAGNGRVCWHYAALTLLHTAATVAERAQKPRMTDAEYAAAVAACDDLF